MRLAAEQGALTIDADKIVHELLNDDTAVQEAIVEAFGSHVRLADGRVDRAKLGHIVFDDAASLAQLEKIVHPAVIRQVANLIQNSEITVIMLEAIKLLESELRLLCREIWVTDCSYELQLQRLRVCRGMDEATAIRRINAQSPAQDKVELADVVLDTNGLMRDTERQFMAAWSRLHPQEMG